jgi:hypothetical protein
MNCSLGNAIFWLVCSLPWFDFQSSNFEDDDFSKAVLAPVAACFQEAESVAMYRALC